MEKSIPSTSRRRRTPTEFLRHYHFDATTKGKRPGSSSLPLVSTVTSEAGCYLSRPLRRIAELPPASRMNCLTVRAFVGSQSCHLGAAARLTADHHPIGIAAEVLDLVTDPSQRRDQIRHSHITESS